MRISSSVAASKPRAIARSAAPCASGSVAKECGLPRNMLRGNWSSKMTNPNAPSGVFSQAASSPRAAASCSGRNVNRTRRSNSSFFSHHRSAPASRQNDTIPAAVRSLIASNLLLPAAAGAGKPPGFFGGAKQRLRLVDALLLFKVGIGIGDNAGAGLNVHHPILDQCGSQHDAGVHFRNGRKVADAAGIERTLFFLQLIDDLHGPHFWRSRDGAGGKTRGEGVERLAVLTEPALNIGDNVHHVAVALDEELVSDLNGADLRHTADVVAPEVEQHQMLGPFLGIGEKLSLELLVLTRC